LLICAIPLAIVSSPSSAISLVGDSIRGDEFSWLTVGGLVMDDVDGDGLDELVFANTSSGDVYVVWGQAGGIGRMHIGHLIPDHALLLEPLEYGDGSAGTPALGDVDGDGTVDLVLGLADAEQGAGQLTLFFGRADPVTWPTGHGGPDVAVIEGTSEGMALGAPISGVDLLGGPGDELIACAPGWESEPAGALLVWSDIDPDASPGIETATITLEGTGATCPTVLPIGDLDGAGAPALALGTSSDVTGGPRAVHVVRLDGLTGIHALGDVAWARIEGPGDGAAMGYALTLAESLDEPDLPARMLMVTAPDESELRGTVRGFDLADLSAGTDLAAGDELLLMDAAAPNAHLGQGVLGLDGFAGFPGGHLLLLAAGDPWHWGDKQEGTVAWLRPGDLDLLGHELALEDLDMAMGVGQGAGRWTASGDFDGDGWPDAAFSTYCGGTHSSGTVELLRSALAIDEDGDGYHGTFHDCDDGNPAIYPDAPEICDCMDSDCDDSTPQTERDYDDDGACPCSGDCDEEDASMHPFDLDGDGFSPCDGDCDDEQADVLPAEVELVCDDQLDNDCDGTTDLQDADCAEPGDDDTGDDDSAEDQPSDDDTTPQDEGCACAARGGDTAGPIAWLLLATWFLRRSQGAGRPVRSARRHRPA